MGGPPTSLCEIELWWGALPLAQAKKEFFKSIFHVGVPSYSFFAGVKCRGSSCPKIRHIFIEVLSTSNECRAFKADVRVCQNILVFVLFYTPVNYTLLGVAVFTIYKHYMLLNYIVS